MTRLNSEMISLIDEHVNKGNITKRKHPEFDLWVYNYGPMVQINGEWNPATMMCRGLILDYDYNIVARPFPKFFSLEQWTSIRNKVHHITGLKFRDMFKGKFITTEKVDGSLGIMCPLPDGEFCIATRGSFESAQAIKGTEILRNNPRYEELKNGHPEHTHLFEIIYPENRIVVNYGADEKLIYLASIDNRTGKDVKYVGINRFFEKTIIYSFDSMEDLAKVERTNAEGYVLLFENGIRVKFKFEEYKRLHKIMTEVTPKRIWEILRNGDNIDDWLKGVPDEFYNEVMEDVNEFKVQYNAYEAMSKTIFNSMDKSGSRKTIAQDILDYDKPYPSILFAMLDGKDYADIIWKHIKPKAE